MEILQKAIICATKESLSIDLVAESSVDFADSAGDSVDSARDSANDSARDSADSARDSVDSARDSAMDSARDSADSINDSAFASKITLGDKKFIIAPNHAFLAQFAKTFLQTANPNQNELKDIAKEIANLIVGKAKVLFEEKGQILKLGLPELLDEAQTPIPRHFYAYKCGEVRICIYEIKDCENGR